MRTPRHIETNTAGAGKEIAKQHGEQCAGLFLDSKVVTSQILAVRTMQNIAAA